MGRHMTERKCPAARNHVGAESFCRDGTRGTCQKQSETIIAFAGAPASGAVSVVGPRAALSSRRLSAGRSVTGLPARPARIRRRSEWTDEAYFVERAEADRPAIRKILVGFCPAGGLN